MHSVYWIHSTEHTDHLTQGYIGVTSRSPEIRFAEHIKRTKRIPENVKLTILHNDLSEARAFEIEKELRPTWYIGWNKCPGGTISGRPKGIHTSGWKHSKAASKRHSLASSGENNAMFGKCGPLHPRWIENKQQKILKGKASGARHGRAKPISIDGVIYQTMKEASIAMGIDRQYIRTRIASGKYPTWMYAQKSHPVRVA